MWVMPGTLKLEFKFGEEMMASGSVQGALVASGVHRERFWLLGVHMEVFWLLGVHREERAWMRVSTLARVARQVASAKGWMLSGKDYAAI